MAVVRFCVLVFLTIFHTNVSVSSKSLEMPQSDMMPISFRDEIIEKFKQLESKLDNKFTQIFKQLKDSTDHGYSLNEKMAVVIKKTEKIQINVEGMVNRQKRVKSEMKAVIKNNTLVLSEQLNDAERNLHNITSQTSQLQESVDHLSNKMDILLESGLQATSLPNPTQATSPSTQVTDNFEDFVVSVGENVQFVCASNESTIGTVVSWFHVHIPPKNDKELIAMDDVVFAAYGNFTAERINERTNMLNLYDASLANSGIYECQIDLEEAIAKHRLTVQEDNEPTVEPTPVTEPTSPDNYEDFIVSNGDNVQFVCAVSDTVIGKVVSWFHIPPNNDKELIAMDDVVFATYRNFTAERTDERTNMLNLYGASLANSGVYECQSDLNEIIARHTLTVQGGPTSECSFMEYKNTRPILYPRSPVSGSSTNSLSDCTQYCDEDCEAAVYDPFSDGMGGTCELVDKGTVAAISHSDDDNYYHRDCFASTFGECNIETHMRCSRDGKCISYGNICNGVEDCSDGSDEKSCDNQSVRLQYPMEGIAMLQIKGKTAFICDDGSFTPETANVICISTGFPYGGKIDTSHSNVRPQAWIKSLVCNGSETSVFDCEFTSSTATDGCGSKSPIAVYCQNYG